MGLLKISISVIICTILFGCKNNASSANNETSCSTDDLEYDLERVCLKFQNKSITFSMKIRTDEIINDYRYLGSLHVNKNNFKVLQKAVLSGQNIDSQRASVSVRLYLNGNLYGEYAGLNNFYGIKISSSTIYIWNYCTKSEAKYEIKDSIPRLLFFPYNDNDTSSGGDNFYLNKFCCHKDTNNL